MVTLEQFKKGLYKYIDDTFISKIPGLKKWGIVWIVESYLNKYETVLLQNRQFLIDAGCITEDGMIDIDKLYSEFMDISKRYGKVTEHLPLFDDTTFSELDIEELKRCILC